MADAPDLAVHVRRHMRAGWWSLLVYLTMGVVLESFHGFKLSWYLGPQHESRRLLWTLAHAHGTLLGLIQIAFAAYLKLTPPARPRGIPLASTCLIASSVLIPLGFFIGGLVEYGGDPGLGVLLVPIAAPLLIVAVLIVALST
jgi:hypothetical protein